MLDGRLVAAFEDPDFLLGEAGTVVRNTENDVLPVDRRRDLDPNSPYSAPGIDSPPAIRSTDRTSGTATPNRSANGSITSRVSRIRWKRSEETPTATTSAAPANSW